MPSRELLRTFLAQREQDRQRAGHAPDSLTGQLQMGAVCIIRDEAIQFPEDRLRPAGTRSLHESRRVIALQRTEICQRDDILTILVAPCTGSHKGDVPPWSFRIPDDEPGFTKSGVVAMLSLLQPILKRDIIKVEAVLSPMTWGRICGCLGLLLPSLPAPPAGLPPLSKP